jgi:vacuolar-type H+-ATPase subunit D/Vma8
MGEVMKEAAFSLAEAKFATGEFNQVVLQNVTKAQIKIRTKKDNVAGMYRFNACIFDFHMFVHRKCISKVQSTRCNIFFIYFFPPL